MVVLLSILSFNKVLTDGPASSFSRTKHPQANWNLSTVITEQIWQDSYFLSVSQSCPWNILPPKRKTKGETTFGDAPMNQLKVVKHQQEDGAGVKFPEVAEYFPRKTSENEKVLAFPHRCDLWQKHSSDWSRWAHIRIYLAQCVSSSFYHVLPVLAKIFSTWLIEWKHIYTQRNMASCFRKLKMASCYSPRAHLLVTVFPLSCSRPLSKHLGVFCVWFMD